MASPTVGASIATLPERAEFVDLAVGAWANGMIPAA